MIHFIYDGKTLKEGTAIISAGNRGLQYGDGVFETMKWVNNKLLLADEHFARLWKGMAALGFDIPRQLTPEKLLEETRALVAKNGHEKAARVRLQVLRGDGGLYDTRSHSPHYIIQSWPLAEGSGEWNSNGLVLGTYDAAGKNCDALANLKHNNYLPYAMAALHAQKEKWNDALLLNSRGNICESSIANVFIIKNETVSTPALAEACVAGIMRAQVIKTLRAGGWRVLETAIGMPDLLQADEIFLTNSIHPLRWVQQCQGRQYTSALSQKIYSAVVPTIV